MKRKLTTFSVVLFLLLIAGGRLAAEVAVEEVVQAGRFVFYRDHADPHKYYYVPDQPRLATRSDGTPEFTFIKYTKTDSTTRGGVIHFLVTWGFTDNELRSAESALKSVDTEAKLAGPVPFKEGTFQIISATAGQDGIFSRRIVGEGKAPLLPGQKAAVSIALTEEGASLLWESFQNPTSDVSVQYVLKFSGITPAFQAKLKVDWDKVYSQHDIKLGAEGTIKMVKLKADVGAMLEELRQKGAIQLDILGENENMEKLLETAYNHILQLMCDQVPTGGGTAPSTSSSFLWQRNITNQPFFWTKASWFGQETSKTDLFDWLSPEENSGGPNVVKSIQEQSQPVPCDNQSSQISKNYERTALALFKAEQYKQAIHYYELAYEACPDPKHLYSISWIKAYNLYESVSAKQTFELFLEKSANFPAYEGLRNEASNFVKLVEEIEAAIEEIDNLANQRKYHEALKLIGDYSQKIPSPTWLYYSAYMYTELGLSTGDVYQLAKARFIVNEAKQGEEEIGATNTPFYEQCLMLSERIEEGIIKLGPPEQAQQAAQATDAAIDQTGAVRTSEEETRRARRQKAQTTGQTGGQQQAQAETGGATAAGAQTATGAATTDKKVEDLKGGVKTDTSTKPAGTIEGGTKTPLPGDKSTPPATTAAGQAATAAGQTQADQAASTQAAAVSPTINVQLGYTFKRTKLSGKYEVDMRRRLREDREIVMSGNISGVYKNFGEDKRFFSVVSLDDPAFQERTVEVILDGQDADDFKNYVNSVSVIFRKQRMGGPVMTGEVKFFEQQFAEKGNRLSYKYSRVNEASTEWLNYEYRTKWNLYGGVEWESDWVKTSDSVLTLTPPVRRRAIEISVDEDNILQNKVKAVAIQVKHNIFGRDILKEVVIDYDKGDPLQLNYTYLHEDGKHGYSYRLIWLLLDGKEVETNWAKRESPFLFAVFSK